MTVKGNIKGTTVERYLDEREASETRNIERRGDKLYLPHVYCHNGHLLSTDKVKFEGLPAVHLLVRYQAEDFDVFLSPIINDQSKEGPDFPEGAKMQLLCPICREVLPQLVPCTCGARAYRRALYLTDKPAELCAIGICEVYGCPQSFVNDNGELLYEIVRV